MTIPQPLDILKKLAKSKKLGPLAGILVVLVAVIILGTRFGLWRKIENVVGWWFWWGLLFVVAVGIVVVVLWVLPRYRERRFLERLRSEDDKASDEVETSHEQLREKMLDAIRTLKNSPELKRKGGLPLYTLPWYLLIGASQTGKTTLLRQVTQFFSPFAPSSSGAGGPTQNCDWWFFNTAIILDTSGRYAFPVEETRDGAGWYRFLRLLRHYRELQPINGMIIAVAADSLIIKRVEELRHDASELRKRIDETIRELGVDFPIYLLLTRCDLIEGFTEFFDCLPDHTLKQVLGYIHDVRPQPKAQQPFSSTFHFAEIFEGIVKRLHQLRLSIYNEEKLPSEQLRQRIFCFPEEFRALQQPLTTFVETLLAENPFQHTPFFRGFFFSSVQQQGTPLSLLRQQLHVSGQVPPLTPRAKTYFLHDLFAVVLPRDQYLVQPTATATRGRLFKHLFGLASCLVLALMIVLFLAQSYWSDQRILNVTDETPCTVKTEQPAEPRLDQVESCRQVVQTLSTQNAQRATWTKLVFDRSGSLEKRLREQYVEKFTQEVLLPIDTRIEDYLRTGSDTIPLVFLLIKRIELIKQCLSGTSCPEPIEPDLQPDYQLMLDPARQRSPTAEQVSRLALTYETYLHWSIAEQTVLQEQEILAEYLRRWFSAKQFAPQQILLWANANYPPITAQTYWEVPTKSEKLSLPPIAGAYTQGAWKRSILPFLQRAREVLPDLAPQLDAFTQDYYTQYFEQWQRFLRAFPQGELPWWKTSSLRRQLALKLLTDQSPYQRVLDGAFEHLQPLLPAEKVVETALPEGTKEVTQPVVKIPIAAEKIQQQTNLSTIEPPEWARLLQHYISSEYRKSYTDSLQQINDQLAGVAPMEKSFELAQAGFREGKPAEKSTHPVFKAWWAIHQFREKEGAGGDKAAEAFWPLLERPVLFVWRVILEGAAEFLQKRWAENVVAPTEGLSSIEQLTLLYGPQGKVREFVNQSVAPFLVDNESRLGQVLGEEVPLSPDFLKMLSDEKQLRPILDRGQATPQRVRVEAARESSIDSELNIIEEKTEFLLECATKTFQVNNRPKDIREASVMVFWSFDGCGDVLITITMSCERLCVERAASLGISVPEVSALQVTKRYTGQMGFLSFIQDFSTGSHTFSLTDFADSYPLSMWPQVENTLRTYRVRAITIFYRLDVPSMLSKLVSLVPGSMISPTIIK